MTQEQFPSERRSFPGRFGLVIEAVLTLSVIVALYDIVKFFLREGYLPQPFVYVTNGTFADWFNTAYWAHNPGAYDIWRSVYPPISFVFLKFVSLGSCYRDSELHFEIDCDWLSKLAIFAICAINVILIVKIYYRNSKRTALFRIIAFCFGLPMLYAIERGNLVLPCLTLLMLGYGRVIRQSWLRWICIAATINFKPYLFLPALSYLFRKKWRHFEGLIFATAFVYLATFSVIGAGDPLTIFENQRGWFEFVGPQYWWNIYYSTSYAPIISAIIHGPYPLLKWVDSRTVDLFTTIIPLSVRLGQVGVLACFVAAWFRPRCAPAYRLSALCLTLILTATNPAGYAEVFLLFFVFLEPWKSWGAKIALIAAYLLSIPFDHIIFGVGGLPQDSWLGHRRVSSNFGLSFGQFIRPGVLLILQYGLVIATMEEAFKGVRLFNRGEKSGTITATVEMTTG